MKYPFLDLGAVNAPYADELVKAAERVVRSGRYVGGEEVERLESMLSGMTGAPYIIGVSNGLDALRLILKGYVALGVMKNGDEVIVPGNTYVASLLAITDAGLKPVPVDADIQTMNIDSQLVEKAVTPKTKAIMTVHLYGRVAWDNTLADIAKRYGLKVIEDNAQGIGGIATTAGLYGSRRTGSLGDAAAFSFYPTKNVGALGDAGAVATHDKELAMTVRALANYGSDRRYHNIYLGYNCRLDPMQAAMLTVKLPHTDRENADRFERAVTYSRNIQRPDVVTPMMSETVTDNVWHQYVLRVTNGKRAEFISRLAENGVGTDIHYATPPHRQPCYAGLPHSALPVTELLADEVVSLPIATGTSVKDAAEISEIINRLEL
ncbi:MAG: DegT/DnrJ/EryC1/StrS family aminotransferase [Duncaniella sp.]|nr:DegT/DnrJ/EryC1/StrS family aminotransferase [Duncaniella sp.]